MSEILSLIGPTASGKTALALQLAQYYPLEIISVDSALVYRGMDIGTAKPSADELAQVPHHLIDIIDPTDSYSAASFCTDAQQLITDIRARGKLPLLVGGTMLYIKALEQGLSDLPQADPIIRAQLDADAVEQGWPALHQRLTGIDPATAARLAPTDAQRIQRALEVYLISGQPMSALLAQSTTAPALKLHKLALIPSDRAWLHLRIAQRFEQMLTAGFLDELRMLRQKCPALNLSLPSMRCVGYRQAWQYLDGELSDTQLLEQGIAATRQLAKRQLTWLRAMPDLTIIDCQQNDLLTPALTTLKEWIAPCPLPSARNNHKTSPLSVPSPRPRSLIIRTASKPNT